MLYIFHYFSNVVRPHGSMVDSADSAPGDGCSSSKIIHGILLCFGCLFERIFLSAETSALKATTFYAQLETLIKYIPISTHTYRYMHIHDDTYNNTQILTHCMYVYIFVCICRYTHVLVIIPYYQSVSVRICWYQWNMQVYVGIASIHQYPKILPISIGITCMNRYQGI